MADFPDNKLQLLLDAAPDTFGGFSASSGDSLCLNRALDYVTPEERVLLFAIMEHGGKIPAIRALGGGDIAKTVDVGNTLRNTLTAFRRQFDIASDQFDGPTQTFRTETNTK